MLEDQSVIMTSVNMRCLRRLCSKAVDLVETSGEHARTQSLIIHGEGGVIIFSELLSAEPQTLSGFYKPLTILTWTESWGLIYFQ